MRRTYFDTSQRKRYRAATPFMYMNEMRSQLPYHFCFGTWGRNIRNKLIFNRIIFYHLLFERLYNLDSYNYNDNQKQHLI